MLPLQVPVTGPHDHSRCDQRSLQRDQGIPPGPIQRSDASLKASVEQAVWRDEVLRAIEYGEIDIHTHNGIVYLDGHIANSTSRIRIENAVRSVAGIAGIRNRLISDDRLTLEVAGALGALEHSDGSKFFTGSSHGVVSITGTVSSERTKRLAERYAAGNPNVRAVINHVRVSGAPVTETQDRPFLQPVIGETIYFLDGPAGIVEKVIVNPHNRRVTAMLLRVSFSSPHLSGPLVLVSMDAIRYLTKVSGFLLIASHEESRYWGFDPASFISPGGDWAPPYPYCHRDVLFLTGHPEADVQTAETIHPFRFTESPFAADGRGSYSG